MDTHAAANLLCYLLVVLSRKTYCSADCEALTKCMTNLGAHMENAIIDLDHFSKESMTRFYDTICGDLDDLVKCYSPQNYEGCSSLQKFVQFVPSQDELRKQFESTCIQKEELVSAVECFTKGGVSLPLKQCTMAMVSHMYYAGSDQEGHRQHTCLAMLTYNSCAIGVIEGKCKEETVQYLKVANKEQYNAVCSAPKIIFNLMCICILTILSTFL